MRSRDFAFWLQGFFEIGGGESGLNATQTAAIKQHLGLVFAHDPDMGAPAHPPAPVTHVAPEPFKPYPGTSGDFVQNPLRMIC